MLCNSNPFDGAQNWPRFTGREGQGRWAGIPVSLGHPWHHKYLRNPCSLIRTFSGSSSAYINPLCPLSPCWQVKEPQNLESSSWISTAKRHQVSTSLLRPLCRPWKRVAQKCRHSLTFCFAGWWPGQPSQLYNIILLNFCLQPLICSHSVTWDQTKSSSWANLHCLCYINIFLYSNFCYIS